MAIRMLRKDGQYMPILVCDVCQDRIEKWSDGLECTIPSEADRQEGGISNVFHVHKGHCDRELQGVAGKGGFDELPVHLYRLMLNLNIGPDDLAWAKRSHELQNGF